MIRYIFVCLALLILSAGIQQWTPELTSFCKAHILVIPLFFFCICHVQRYTTTLCFALIAGLMWDSEQILTAFELNIPDDEIKPVDNLRFGYSIFLFGIVGFYIKFIQAFLPFRGLLVNYINTFIALLLFILLDNFLILYVRGSLPLDGKFFLQIGNTAFFTSLISPLVYLILYLLWKPFQNGDQSIAGGLDSLLSNKL